MISGQIIGFSVLSTFEIGGEDPRWLDEFLGIKRGVGSVIDSGSKPFVSGGQNGKLKIGSAVGEISRDTVTLLMPFPMKIQPIDSPSPEEFEPVKPVVKSRLKRLFERQFPSVLRISSPAPEKVAVEEPHLNKDGCNGSSPEFEPSSACLSRMVQNFIEESNEKQAIKCGRNRCNCFNRNCIDSFEDDSDSFNDSNCFSSTEACELLKVKG